MMNVALGEPIIIRTAVLEPGSLLVPTGTVILRNGKNTIAIARLDDMGNVVFTISSNILGVGIHEVVVFYAGDRNCAPTSSNILEVNVLNEQM
jgi:hypothetical protein